MHEALNPNGKLLLVEPKLHVRPRYFEREVNAALQANFKLIERPSVRLSHAALFVCSTPASPPDDRERPLGRFSSPGP